MECGTRLLDPSRRGTPREVSVFASRDTAHSLGIGRGKVAMMHSVYIVEDSEDMRFILKRLIRKRIEGAQVVGESETAEKALEEIPLLCPDVALVDISLPGMDGIELIRRLRVRCTGAWILVVTGHQVNQYRNAALDAGADDIISKADTNHLVEVVRSAFDKSGKGV